MVKLRSSPIKPTVGRYKSAYVQSLPLFYMLDYYLYVIVVIVDLKATKIFLFRIYFTFAKK